MSRWIDKDLFAKYVEQKEREIDAPPSGGLRRSDFVWPTPAPGTAEKPKVYEGRLLQDPKGLFTKKYYYHMWKSNDKMVFYLCPKTDDFSNWCALCAITSKLYTGTESDKKLAYEVKRKERHIANFYIVNDPRDRDVDDVNKKSTGKVKIYEFPSKLESKIKDVLLDKQEGLGYAIFDPDANGFNLLVKVSTTKADKSGKIYPDYSNSLFSRRSSTLGTQSEIESIMKQRFSLNDYLNDLKTKDSDLKAILKNERLWDLIEDEWNRMKGSTSNLLSGTPPTKVESDPDSMDDEDDVKDYDPDISSEEDLLKELENL